MLLKVDHLRVSYGGVEALKSISLELDEDEAVGILGANGAGKSTLIKTVSGLKPPTEGEIWFDNQRIRQTLHPDNFRDRHSYGTRRKETFSENQCSGKSSYGC